MKILLCNEAFIGDLILSTAVLPVLKKAIPDCKIGFLTGSWSKEILEDHQLLDYLHIHDQKSLNRRKIPKKDKKRQEIHSRKLALQEIAAIQYDVALDLHSYYSTNSAYLLFRAKIPERAAFWICNSPFFYTQKLVWDCKKHHALENHKIMLSHLGIEEKFLENFKPCLSYHSQISGPQNLPEKYICIHAHAGYAEREWDTDLWQSLCTKLETLGFPLVFLGKGIRDKIRIAKITGTLKNAISLCDKISLKETMHVIQNAQFLIGMESMAGHMAANFGIPALLIYTAGATIFDWRPYHPYCHVIKPDPKYYIDPKTILPKKPIDMICPDEVFEKAKKILKAHSVI